ncbi:MAG TPA: hypothetical protein VHG09_12900 [Longimicrobiales bacterium]|nr:hypothetical protein [Longimicrobiales bacterium]
MADRKTPKDVGRDAPGSKIAKEQRMAGTSSGPQEAKDAPPTPKQPPQTSNRRGKAHEHEPTVRKGYEAAQNPERQGDGDPGPEQISERSSMQGHGGRAHGSGPARGNDSTEQSQGGTPSGGHTREGRQSVPGDRDPQQPE